MYSLLRRPSKAEHISTPHLNWKEAALVFMFLTRDRWDLKWCLTQRDLQMVVLQMSWQGWYSHEAVFKRCTVARPTEQQDLFIRTATCSTILQHYYTIVLYFKWKTQWWMLPAAFFRVCANKDNQKFIVTLECSRKILLQDNTYFKRSEFYNWVTAS